MTETELVKQVAAGAEAFSALVTLYRPALVIFCARRVGAEDAEEAAQDALFKAWQSFAQWNGSSTFKTWVWSIAKNECNRLLRSREDTTPLEMVHCILDGDHRDDRLISEEQIEAVMQEIEKLSPMQRQCILMLGNDSRQSEIALTLGISPSSVRYHICKARAHLTKTLGIDSK